MATIRLCVLLLLPTICEAFLPSHVARGSSRLFSTVESATVSPTLKDLDELKTALVFVCNRKPAAALQEVRDAVEKLESLGEQVRTVPYLP
jgi:hypothetical protein